MIQLKTTLKLTDAKQQKKPFATFSLQRVSDYIEYILKSAGFRQREVSFPTPF